ncbi:phospholipid carrier-dependent glycosyltransferase [Planctomicrobium sp. SH664]|uniref:phospholipid carrier-dependent glycosyltransferase n=1 Tax=Planctomicrobium sp. SH664 TaxID=3448125 RepID=UPI003F5BBD81
MTPGVWTGWNRFPESPRGRLWLCIAIGLLAWGTYLTYYSVWFGLNAVPSATGDEPSYDSLGWELAHGRGFQIDTGEPEFRAPYDVAARQSDLYALGAPHVGPITFRPPLYPLALSVGDRLFGRQLWFSRVLNSFCLATICALVCWWVHSRWGLVPALLGAAMFVLLDTNTRLYGRAYLTEPLCALWVTLLFVTLWWDARNPSLFKTHLAGLIFGLGVLTRSMLILWLPGLLLVVYWMVTASQASQGRESTSATPLSGAGRRLPLRLQGASHAVQFLVIVMLVLFPWGLRNCLVLQRLMPLGTQGTVQLTAGYSDLAWERRGIWPNMEVAGHFDPVLTRPMTIIEKELVMADYSKQQAFAWIRQNPLKALALFPMKIYQEVLPRTWPQAILTALALVGAAAFFRRKEVRLLLALILIDLTAIGLTWSVADGRFLLPLLFAEHFLAAAGLWWLVCRVRGIPCRLETSVPS